MQTISLAWTHPVKTRNSEYALVPTAVEVGRRQREGGQTWNGLHSVSNVIEALSCMQESVRSEITAQIVQESKQTGQKMFQPDFVVSLLIITEV